MAANRPKSAPTNGRRSAGSARPGDKSTSKSAAVLAKETPRQLQRRLLKVYERNCAALDCTVMPSVKKTLREGMQKDAFQARFFIHMPDAPPPDPDIIALPDETPIKVSLVALIDAIRQTRYTHIRLLYIWSVTLTHDDLISLALLLDKGSYLIKHLEIVDCLMEPHSIPRLSFSLNCCSTLQSLVLYYNQFGNARCRSLCSGLRCNTFIQSLSLNYCGLGVDSGAVLGCLIATTALKEVYLDGNDLQCEGVVDLIRLCVQQAVREDGDRQIEAERKALEEANAIQLERDKKYNYSYNDLSEVRDDMPIKLKPEGKKKKRKRRGRKSKKRPPPPPPVIGPWIYKLHLADNGIDAMGKGERRVSNGQDNGVSLLDCLQMIAKLVMYSKCLQEIDLDKNLIGEVGGYELVRALEVREQQNLPSIKLRTTRRVSPDCLPTLMRLGAGLKKKPKKPPKKK